eukprot:gene20064-26051_t
MIDDDINFKTYDKQISENGILNSTLENNKTIKSSYNKQIPKQRGPKPSKVEPRKPYFTYISDEGILIKVGRTAADNDELSLNKEHRDNNHWWLHVAGSAGSHVVICDSNDDLPNVNRQTLLDAAILAATNSKGPKTGKVRVTYTRCRHITKPHGVPAGTVQIRDEISTVTVNISNEVERLKRLLPTKNQPLQTQ